MSRELRVLMVHLQAIRHLALQADAQRLAKRLLAFSEQCSVIGAADAFTATVRLQSVKRRKAAKKGQ